MATISKKEFDEILSSPPIYHLLGVCDKITGNHFQSAAWKGLAGQSNSHEPGIPVVVKHLDSPVQIDIELACGLVSQVLMLPVPKPALVYADRDLLPDAPKKVIDGAILFGSRFQTPDAYLAKQNTNDERVGEDIYSKVCATEVGPLGSAWDELVANPDRHPYNFIFDGKKWWLFDHNKALEPLNRILEEIYNAPSSGKQREILTHAARINLLYSEMLKRDLGVTDIQDHAKLMTKKAKELKVLADRMTEWITEDDAVNSILKMSATIVAIIGSRLSPLMELIHNRSQKPAGRSLWTPES